VVVTVELTNALSGFNMWSHTYDRDQNDIVDVQTDIALAVMRALHVASPVDETARLTLGGTANAAAYDAYLRGIKLRREAKVEADYRAAVAAFDTALTLDPGFALAHARRATALTALELRGTYTAEEQQKLEQAAMLDADRAVALAPMLGFAHLARGVILGHGFLNLETKLDEVVKAEALSPGNATIAANVSSLELALGHVDRALEAARRATQLDPLGPDEWEQLAKTLYESHHYDEALAALDHERVATGTLPERAMVPLAIIRLMQGRPADARAVCAPERSWHDTEILAVADQALGRQDAAAADLAKLRAELRDGGAINYAEIYAQWGQKPEALHWLDEAVRLKDPGLYDVVLDPFLDPIRSEPRFKDVLRRLMTSGTH
jgi:tetratricopeptide (TPR) repeat protein